MKNKSEKLQICICSALIILAAAIVLFFGIRGIQKAYTRQLTGIMGMLENTEAGQEDRLSQFQVDKILSGKISSDDVTKGQHYLRTYGYRESAAGLASAQIRKSIVMFSAAVVLLAILSIGVVVLLYREKCRFYHGLARAIRYPDSAEVQEKELVQPVTGMLKSRKSVEKPLKVYETAERRELFLALQEHHEEDARKEILIKREQKAIADWVEDVAHQLKTPLTVLGIQIERMESTEKYNKRRVQKASAQVDKMTDLIAFLMKKGRLSANTYHMEIQRHEVQKLLDRVQSETFSICQKHQTELVCTLNGENEFYYDERWMAEAVGNLVKNGAEHAGNKTRIELHFLVLNTGMRITVRDYGSGIDEKQISVIFDRYVSSSRQTDSSGGIGLSIAKQIVEEHFGKITAQNQEEGGVLFTIFLPLLNGSAVYEETEIRQTMQLKNTNGEE